MQLRDYVQTPMSMSTAGGAGLRVCIACPLLVDRVWCRLLVDRCIESSTGSRRRVHKKQSRSCIQRLWDNRARKLGCPIVFCRSTERLRWSRRPNGRSSLSFTPWALDTITSCPLPRGNQIWICTNAAYSAHLYTSKYTHMYIYRDICMYIFIHTNIHSCVYINICVYMCISYVFLF